MTTSGRVAILGKTGKNFAAGMSGGVAYVLDMDSDLYTKVNKQMVNIEKVTSKFDVSELKGMIEEHVAATNSETGKEILDHFKRIPAGSLRRSFRVITRDADPHPSAGREKVSAANRQNRSILCDQRRKIGGQNVGKATGFMDYDRRDAECESQKERIKHFREFHRLCQRRAGNTGRQMYGIRRPVLPGRTDDRRGWQSGCPLHNLVPEWNDLIYHGNWEGAYYRLKKTNNFPEFTSRGMPGLCEAACTCNLHGSPVTTKSK